MSLLLPPAAQRRRLTAEEEFELSTSIRQTERQVEERCRKIPAAAAILDVRTKRKELTSSRHVDRLTEAVRVVRNLRPRPESALAIAGLWKETEDKRWVLAMSGYRIAVGEARKMGGRGLDHEDLVNEGIVGLLDAAKRFDPSRKLRFSTYARWWVRARMMRAIDTTGTTVRLPGGLLERLRRVSMLRALIERDVGTWSVEQISEQIGLPSEEVRQILAVEEETQVVPMSASPLDGSDDRRSLEETLADDRELPQDRSAELSKMLWALRHAVERLPSHYRSVVSLYLGLEPEGQIGAWTLQSAADTIGVSRERIRQLLLQVRDWVAEELSEDVLPSPELDESPPVEQILLSLDRRGSSLSVARRVYGKTFRKAHVLAIEEQLYLLEEQGQVHAFPGEHRTLWGRTA